MSPAHYLRLATLLLALSLLPSLAMAQSTEQRLAQILEAARDDYDMLMLDEAEEALEFGVSLAERENVSSPTVANLFVMLGIVRHAQDPSLAEDAFVKAIETYPSVELDPLYRTPALQEIFERAQGRAEPPSPTVATGDTPDDLQAMTHEPLRRARAQEALLVEARIPEDLPVFRVYFYFRRFGETDFSQTEMLPSDAVTFAVTLEPDQVYTSQLEYFILAVNRAGDPIAEAGRQAVPYRIALLGSTDVGERPIADPGDGLDEREAREPREPRDPTDTGFYGFLAGGTDIGFLPSGTPPTANQHRTVSPGLAPAFAHTHLELGWRVSQLNNIGLYFRWQFSPPQDFSQLPPDRFDANAPFFQSQQECFGMGLPGDCLLGLKYQRVITSGTPEFYSSVGLGVGRVRNWLRLKEATSEANPNPVCSGRDVFNDPNFGQFCYIRDTVRTGWFHFGFGGGLFLPVHSMVDLVVDSYIMVLVPDTSVNLDLNLGIRFRP